MKNSSQLILVNLYFLQIQNKMLRCLFIHVYNVKIFVKFLNEFCNLVFHKDNDVIRNIFIIPYASS